jgi:hypothetical protein
VDDEVVFDVVDPAIMPAGPVLPELAEGVPFPVAPEGAIEDDP